MELLLLVPSLSYRTDILDGTISLTALLTQSCLLEIWTIRSRGRLSRISKLDDQPDLHRYFNRSIRDVYLPAATFYLTPSIFPSRSHLSSFLRLQFFRRFFECLAFPATISHPPPHASRALVITKSRPAPSLSPCVPGSRPFRVITFEGSRNTRDPSLLDAQPTRPRGIGLTGLWVCCVSFLPSFSLFLFDFSSKSLLSSCLSPAAIG